MRFLVIILFIVFTSSLFAQDPISLDEFEDNRVTSNHEIRYNQLGYFLGRDKVVSINSTTNFSGLAYTIKDVSGTVVKFGVTPATSWWTDAQEYVSTIDFSEINSAGEYTVDVGGIQEILKIGNTIYNDLSLASLKYYYYSRSGTAITTAYGSTWTRPTGISDTQVKIHSSAASTLRPTGTIISAPKGWFDAGDYNKYVVNSGITTYTLLAAFEHYKLYYETKDFNLPESGNSLPDLLDEVIWNLDWLLKMQDPNDGGVYHKLTGLNFSGIGMPNAYTAERFVVKKSTAAALDFAAVTAIASRIFSYYESEKPGYSAQLKQASKDAYAWAKANPTDYFTNPSGVSTGQYGDTNVSDEFQWAATELFITTGEAQYKNDITVASINNGVPSWPGVGSLALFSINHHATAISSDVNVTTAKTKLLATANAIKTTVNSSAMKISMESNNYVWGSNSVAANQVFYLIRAYEVSKDTSYLKAAYTAMDYLLGRNGTGFSFVTGYGKKTPMHPHHRVSEADGISDPIPGMLAGGPQPGQQDKCTTYPSILRAKSYTDTWCSYASNEVAINWNAPLVYVVNALQYYQNEGVALSVDDVEENTEELIQLYPNPVENTLLIKLENLKIESVIVFTVEGKEIFNTNESLKNNQIDFSNFESGIYFVKVRTGKRTFIKKMIKK